MNYNPYLNAIRMLGIDEVNKANSGHPGIVLGASPIIYTLFTEIMRITPDDPQWFNRDRFILSAGHGSAMLYATLHLSGYKISKEDLRHFRQLGSVTPGHPDRSIGHGIEVTSGPLGQGVAMGVGMAIAEEYLAAQYNRPHFPIINHFTYVLCSDGDLQEGISQEALSLAGKQKLKKLILIHDSNDVQLDSLTVKAINEDFHLRFKASGWDTIKIENGEDDLAIKKAIKQAKKNEKPTYIEVKTVIGLGAKQQGTNAVHGAPLKDLAETKSFYHWPYAPFEIPQAIYDFYNRNVRERVNPIYEEWKKMIIAYQHQYPKDYLDLIQGINQEWNIDYKTLNQMKPNINIQQPTRVSAGLIVDFLMKTNRNFIGGSADLSGSTKIRGFYGDFNPDNRGGQNIYYGVREFAMGGINNGIAAHGGLLPIGATFLGFSDYLKPSIRLAALMEIQNLFVFSHDSIALGEDGATHQPIEQLTMLRSIPNVNLFRPADYEETLVAFEFALRDKKQPTIIVTTRQELKQQIHHKIQDEVRHGGYILSNTLKPEVTLIACGSEVELAMRVKACLEKHEVRTRVVSMPSTYLFDRQNEKYQQKIIDKKSLIIALEMGSPDKWYKYVRDDGFVFGIESFGASGKWEEVVKSFGFESERICHKIRLKLKEKQHEFIS